MVKELGMITISLADDHCITLNKKTLEHFVTLHQWLNGEGDEAKYIETDYNIYSIPRKHVIKISFSEHTA